VHCRRGLTCPEVIAEGGGSHVKLQQLEVLLVEYSPAVQSVHQWNKGPTSGRRGGPPAVPQPHGVPKQGRCLKWKASSGHVGAAGKTESNVIMARAGVLWRTIENGGDLGSIRRKKSE